MHKVLTEIDVLASLSSSYYMISPLNACCVVFIDRGVWVLWEAHVFCSFDLHCTMCLLYLAISPVVELQDTLFPQ